MSMETTSLRRVLGALATVAGVGYLVVGVAGDIWPGHWDDTGAGDQILWLAFGVVGGALVLAGWRQLDRSPKLAAALISVGAIVGALPIFWTIVALLLALALVVLSVLYARGASAAWTT
jgi:hypothetical protein